MLSPQQDVGPLGRSTGDSKGAKTLVRHGILLKEKRIEMFGLDCPDLLEWRNWQPGTEYSKNLLCKNVSTKAIKITYKQTASKAFSMGFPEPIKLRPGMSCPLKVIFRPMRLQQYSDHIEIMVNDTASFIVLVEAYTPATHIQVPTHLPFGFVPCKEVQQQPLVVSNSGDVQVAVSWQLDPPFSISPSSASIPPGSSAQFQVSFLPQEAGSYTANATCSLQGAPPCVCVVSGVAKFPYLSLEHSTIDFGSVVVGNRIERTLRFGNHSMVNANFTLEPDHPEASDNVFSVTPASGTLGPEEFSVIRVVYTPQHTGTFSCDAYSLHTPGGNKLPLTLKGTAAPPVLTFSTRLLNYGSVTCGSTPSRVLYMQNQSNVPIVYDFQVDPQDCFTFSKPQGTVNPGLTSHVTVTFKSGVAANYWRRVVCLIKDAEPVGIDLIATAYSEAARPPPLEPRHVHTYLSRVADGGAVLDYDPTNFGSVPASPVPSNPEERPCAGTESEAGPPAPLPWVGPDAWDLLFEGQDPAHALTVDRDVLWFGSCSRLTASEYQSVVVTNNTAAKVTAFIHAPAWTDPATGQPQAVFQVFPESADIKSGAQVTFKVAFRPTRDAVHVSQKLTVCAFVKSMRNFRLVTDSQVVPPWSIPITACGNTFLHTNPEFSPKINISHKQVAFPPCRPGEQVHQTMTLVNYGDTPASFNFTNTKALAPAFEIKPAVGVVPAKGHVVVALRFRSSKAQPVESKALLTFNGVSVATSEIKLRGVASAPGLVVDLQAGQTGQAAPSAGAKGALFFRPTCVGASASRTVLLRNPSRVPVAWQWQLPPKLDGVVSVSPVSGLVRGLEAVPLTWSFNPVKVKLYESIAHCHMLHPSTASAGPSVTYLSGLAVGSTGLQEGQGVTLKVVGEGTAGALVIEPALVDLGPVMVGHPVKRTVRLENQGDGVLRYCLECTAGPSQPDDTTPGVPAMGDQEPGATPVQFLSGGLTVDLTRQEEVWVDEPEGTIAARASKDVTVTLYPKYRRQYSMQLQCRSATVAQVRPASGSGPGAMRLPPLITKQPSIVDSTAALDAAYKSAPLDAQAVMVMCPLVAQAQFPALQVTDVFCDGAAKPVLWSQLGIQSLNAELASNVTPLELDLEKMENKGTLTTDKACEAMQPFRFDFGCSAQGGAAPTYQVQVTNSSALPVTWELRSYDDPDIELENWVEPGRPRNDRERARDFITEHRIFDVQPRNGALAPGASQSVTLQYRPGHVGKHEFPLFLVVQNGKRVHVQLAGTTVKPPVQQLAIAPTHRVFTFPATAIGTQDPPLHMYVLRNGGPGRCRYRLDLTPLTDLRSAHHSYDVMQLLSPDEGEIPEKGSVVLNWSFSPLEARVYSVTLPIQLGDGSVELVTLQGRGYHPKDPQQPCQLQSEGDRDWATLSGFSPRPSPHLITTRLVLPSQDTLSLGTTLPAGLVRRLLILTNSSAYPVLFDWQLGALGQEGALKGGKLELNPASGRLDPGERVAVRVSFTAPLMPLLLEGDIQCEIAVDEASVFETVRLAQEAADREAAVVEFTETGSVVEEVVVQHPPPRRLVLQGSRTQGHLPVHLGMTQATLAKLGNLGAQWSQTLAQYQAGNSASTTLDIPPPQQINLALTGRVLTRAHIEAGQFIPPHELDQARSQLAGAAWVPPTVQPFFLQPEYQVDPVDEAPLKTSSSWGTSGSEHHATASQPEQHEDDMGSRDEEANEAGDQGDLALLAQQLNSMLPASLVHPDEEEQDEAGQTKAEPGGLKSRRASLSALAAEEDESEAEGQQSGSPAGADLANITFADGVGASGSGAQDDITAQVLSAISESKEEEQPHTPVRTPQGGQPSEQAGAGDGVEALLAAAAASAALENLGVPGGEHEEQDESRCSEQEPACASLPVQTTSITPLNLMGLGQASLPSVPAPPVADTLMAAGAKAAQSVAGLLLQQLLNEVMDPQADPDVSAALHCLTNQPLPAFVQLQKQGVPELVMQGGGAGGSESSIDAAVDATADASQEPAASGEPDNSADDLQDSELQQVLRDQGFQEFAEFVIESTILSLIEESVAGEWEAPPAGL